MEVFCIRESNDTPVGKLASLAYKKGKTTLICQNVDVKMHFNCSGIRCHTRKQVQLGLSDVMGEFDSCKCSLKIYFL